jgi:AraC-like DNA-binding protein
MLKRTHRVELHRARLPGIEALTLFSNHRFPRHSHDEFGIGIMTSGAQRSWSVLGLVDSEDGDVIMVNPGEMHDGVPVGGSARGWKILYLDPALVSRELAAEGNEHEVVLRPVARDPALARHVARFFMATEDSTAGSLALEERLLYCLMCALRRQQLIGPRMSHGSPPVLKAVERLNDAPEAPTSLHELAELCGLSRFQLLRGFAREVGITPHAYLIQRRVCLARRLLSTGSSPSNAALLAGFADQSHMTRAFVRQLGITPGRYKALVNSGVTSVRAKRGYNRAH